MTLYLIYYIKSLPSKHRTENNKPNIILYNTYILFNILY